MKSTLAVPVSSAGREPGACVTVTPDNTDREAVPPAGTQKGLAKLGLYVVIAWAAGSPSSRVYSQPPRTPSHPTLPAGL